MKTILQFPNEQEYLVWEGQKDNTIYAIQNENGKFLGEMKEVDLIPLINNRTVLSFDNPQDKACERLIKKFKGDSANYGMFQDQFETHKEKFVNIVILCK